MAKSNLIFDLGVNAGQDTEFYLLKGFKVVGVEANPLLHGKVWKNLASYIGRGQLTLLNIGIWSERSTLTFYTNLDNDHWSSFDPAYGCRNDTRYDVSDIECIRIGDLLDEFGVPHYMKIDVEGADKHILSDLKNASELPRLISVEEYGVACIDALAGLGYLGFKITPQRDKSWAVPPNPPREGRFVERHFDGYDSGLFGEEVPGNWMDYKSAREYFITNVRNENGKYVGPQHEWHDVHACLQPACQS
jgi:FkbM family methyltransferase